MNLISDVAPLGETSAIDALEDGLGDSDDSASSSGAETDSEESSTEEDEDGALADSSDEEQARVQVDEAGGDYFGLAGAAEAEVPTVQPGSKSLSPVLEPGAGRLVSSPEQEHRLLPAAVPDIVVAQDDATHSAPALTPASAIPPANRRGLSLPGFLRRNSSSRSVSGAALPAFDSGAADSADSVLTATGRHKGKRRFSRKKHQGGEVADAELSANSAAAPASGAGQPVKLRRKHRRKHRSDVASVGPEGQQQPAGGKPKRKKLGRRGTTHFEYHDSGDVLGLVQIEINSANLPRFSNAFKTGFDCDP